jgi:hypothetical protein
MTGDAVIDPAHQREDMTRSHGEHAPDPLKMVREMRAPWLWTNVTAMMLGAWLITSPFTFEYASAAMRASDMGSGVLLVALAGAALSPRFDFIGRWGASLVGLWLQFAPLVFWAPAPVAYANDTLVGAVVIALTILVPMMPGMAHHMAMMKPGPEIPPGWSYNPSSWHQRAPMIALAFTSWLISRHLAAYQLGYISSIWEPFFGQGTVRVLTSNVSRAWPVSDAGLGALAYTLEMLMAWMGGKTRWRSMPWMVTFFFILVVPLGIVSIVLVILQPVSVGHWCTLCLATAALMLVMIPFTVDEVVAMGQFLAQRVRNGKPLWRTFWVGDTIEGGGPDRRTPLYGVPFGALVPSVRWGVSVPWSLAASTGVGLWLMFAPALLATNAYAASNDNLVGALIVTIAVISTAEVIRGLRFLNVLFGVWLLIAPWALVGASMPLRWNDMAAGVALLSFTVPRGVVRERYGTWDRYIV